MSISCFDHLSDIVRQYLSPHRPLFHQAGTCAWLSTCSYTWTATSWQSPELEPSPGELPCRGRALSEVVAARLLGTAPAFIYSHLPHMWAHIHVKATHRRLLLTLGVCLWFTKRLHFFWGGGGEGYWEFQYEQNPFKPTLATTLNPRRQKWNWQSRRQISIDTLMPTCSTRNHAYKEHNETQGFYQLQPGGTQDI